MSMSGLITQLKIDIVCIMISYVPNDVFLKNHDSCIKYECLVPIRRILVSSEITTYLSTIKSFSQLSEERIW